MPPNRCLAFGKIVIPALSLALFAAPAVHAASDTWTGATDATWATSTNWAGSTVPGAGNTATFNGAGNGNTTISLGGGVTLGTLLFDTSSAAAYTIGSGAVGSQTLTFGTANGGITLNSTVANNQLVNANIALSTTGTYNFTNNSTTNTLTVAGGISASTTGNKTLTVTGSGNTSISGIIANGSGTALLTKTGTGTLTLSGANTYTGATTITAGTLQLSGASGATTGATAYTLNGGSLVLDNTTAAGGNNNARIADTSNLSLVGSSFIYKGADAASTNSTETIGTLSGGGASTITVSFGGTNGATLTASSFSHAAGNATYLVNGVNLGKNSTDTASFARFISTTAPTLTGTTAAVTTGINSAAQNTKIVPFLVGEATSTTGGTGTATGTANTFVTYIAGSGFRPLNPTDEVTNNAITSGNNTYITSATSVSASTSINSLVVNGADVSVNDSTTLTNTSGALLFASSNKIKPTGTTGIYTSSAEQQITVNSGVTGEISAVLSGTQNLTKSGAGTLVLSGTTSQAGILYVNTGQVSVTSGTFTSSNNATSNIQVGATSYTGTLSTSSGATVASNSSAQFFRLGMNASSVGILNNAGTFTASSSLGGNFGNGTNSSGAIYNSGTFNGSTAASTGIYLGNNATNSYGYVNNSGTFTQGTSSRLWLGAAGGATGVIDQTGGTFTAPTTAEFYVGSGAGGTAANNVSNTNTQINVTGGTMTLSGASGTWNIIGGTGANDYVNINITGSGKITNAGTTGVSGISLGANSNATNTANLTLATGGTLETSFIDKGALSTGVLSFNNGTLKATAADATALIRSGVSTFVQSGGGTIDNGGFNTTVASALQAPSGSGVTGITLGGTLTGYIGAPVVKITGGGGTGATAIANFNPTTGTITSITITSAGSGYTSTPTITLLGGGGTTGAGAGASTATATATIGAASSGGMTFTGSGTTTLSGTNTYTGATTINGGTVKLGASGSISNSASISIGASATFDTSAQSFSLSGSQPITFVLDPSSAGSAGKIAAAALNVSAGSVSFSTLGTLDDTAYVLATYSAGSLTGTFSSVSSLPSGYYIDYNYLSNNQIALVAVPEPHEFAIAIVALLGVLVFIRRRNQQV